MYGIVAGRKESNKKKKEHTALSQCSKTHIGNKQGTKMKRKSKLIN